MKPKVELLHYTPLKIIETAINTCWDKHQTCTNVVNVEKIDRVANKYSHLSTVEHASFNFYISNISRAVLMELSRHRIASFSVKSSRYTLKELKGIETPFCTYTIKEDGGIFINVNESHIERAKAFVKLGNNVTVNGRIISALEQLRLSIRENISNDITKYSLPDAYLTELTFSINVRSLKNLLNLRTGKSALPEIQDLAHAMFETIPEEFKFLLNDDVHQYEL